ncbi:pirin family protein [bacterium]|nr:pirin family protein [bacterium]MBU1434062.1 pirin family protein [bacterium]MBU1503044.1 pirin family protein [bacterium]
MFKKIPKDSMYVSSKGWLKSRFHFSFAEYINHDNRNFGVLRVLNDDIISSQSGFDMHPHKNMEIVTYIIRGELTHKDSLGNSETLKRGEVQYMSAGSGIAHSEYNLNKNDDIRLLQVWIIPPKNDLPKLYGSHRYTLENRRNKFLPIVSSQSATSKIKLHQDVNIYVSELEKGNSLDYHLEEGRQIYFVQIEGSSFVNGITLEDSDALEIMDERSLTIEALENTHFLFIEMKEA